MARNSTTSLLYTQIPCDLCRSREIQRALARARMDGMGESFTSHFLLIVLLTTMYIHGSVRGYYAVMDEVFIEDLFLESGVPIHEIRTAINLAADSGVIDSDLFRSGQIITSIPIQDLYFRAISRMRRVKPQDTPYLLVDLRNYKFVPSIRNISSEEKDVSSEETCISSEEKSISSEETAQYSNSKSIVFISSISETEREEIELFFHSEQGLKGWARIAEDLITQMDAVGWVDGAGRKIVEKVKYARHWQVREEYVSMGTIFADQDAAKAYSELYTSLQNIEGKILLTHIEKVWLMEKELVLQTCSDELKTFLTTNIELLKNNVTLFNSIRYAG